MSRAGAPAAFVALAALAACFHFGGVRPLYGPVPGSVTLQLNAQPDAVIAAADSEVARAGLVVLHSAPDEGFLETRWYDVATKRTVGPRARDLARTVKLRFYADPLAGETRLAAECVWRIAEDPSEPSQYYERMVGDSTPGRTILDSITARLKAKFPPPAPRPTGEEPKP